MTIVLLHPDLRTTKSSTTLESWHIKFSKVYGYENISFLGIAGLHYYQRMILIGVNDNLNKLMSFERTGSEALSMRIIGVASPFKKKTIPITVKN